MKLESSPARKEGEIIERYTVATAEQEISELNLSEEDAEKKIVKSVVKNAVVAISLSLAFLGDATWASEEIKVPEAAKKDSKEQEQPKKFKMGEEEQSMYDEAIAGVKHYLNQPRDFSGIKNPAIRWQAEINDKFIRIMYQGIIEHPEKVKASIDLKNKTVSFYGTYIDPTTKNELPLFFVYRIQE